MNASNSTWHFVRKGELWEDFSLQYGILDVEDVVIREIDPLVLQHPFAMAVHHEIDDGLERVRRVGFNDDSNGLVVQSDVTSYGVHRNLVEEYLDNVRREKFVLGLGDLENGLVLSPGLAIGAIMGHSFI